MKNNFFSAGGKLAKLNSICPEGFQEIASNSFTLVSISALNSAQEVYHQGHARFLTLTLQGGHTTFRGRAKLSSVSCDISLPALPSGHALQLLHPFIYSYAMV